MQAEDNEGPKVGQWAQNAEEEIEARNALEVDKKWWQMENLAVSIS